MLLTWNWDMKRRSERERVDRPTTFFFCSCLSSVCLPPSGFFVSFAVKQNQRVLCRLFRHSLWYCNCAECEDKKTRKKKASNQSVISTSMYRSWIVDRKRKCSSEKRSLTKANLRSLVMTVWDLIVWLSILCRSRSKGSFCLFLHCAIPSEE